MTQSLNHAGRRRVVVTDLYEKAAKHEKAAKQIFIAYLFVYISVAFLWHDGMVPI